MGHPDNQFVGYYDPTTNSNIGVLTVDGQSFDAVSGGPGSVGPMPDGLYTFGAGEELAPGEHSSMTDGQRKPAEHKKFRFTGLGPSHAGYERTWKDRLLGRPGRPLLNDPNNGVVRSGVLAHCDGNKIGTDGCIGYQDCAVAQGAFQSAYDKGNTLFSVRTTTQEEVERLRKERLGQGAEKPAAKPEPNESKIKHGADIIKGEPSVLIGPQKREAAHVESPHSKGGAISEGKPDVLVGPLKLPMAGVGHQTTDKSAVGTGDQSVLLGN